MRESSLWVTGHVGVKTKVNRRAVTRHFSEITAAMLPLVDKEVHIVSVAGSAALIDFGKSFTLPSGVRKIVIPEKVSEIFMPNEVGSEEGPYVCWPLESLKTDF